MDQPENTPIVPAVSLRDYIRRDLAYAHGISRDMLAGLDAKPKAEWSSTHRQWGLYADKAEIGAIDWIVGNAPGAVPHLRNAGLYIFVPDEEVVVAAAAAHPNMSEVLAGHLIAAESIDTEAGTHYFLCSCDHWEGSPTDADKAARDFADHVAQQLAEAGYGSLHDAWNEGLDTGRDRWMDNREFGATPTNPHPKTSP